MQRPLCFTSYIGSNLMWDRAVLPMSQSCPILQSLEEQINPKKVKIHKRNKNNVLCFTKHIGSNIKWDNAAL